MNNKIEIATISLKIGDTVIVLSKEKAESLRDLLLSIFPIYSYKSGCYGGWSFEDNDNLIVKIK